MTSTQNPEFIPADDVYQALLLALAALEQRSFYTTHATAQAEAGEPTCRCCVSIPSTHADTYVVACAGMGEDSTAALIADRTGLDLSWAGNAQIIVDELRAQGLDASWNGDPYQCVHVATTEEQRRFIAGFYAEEIARLAERDDEDEYAEGDEYLDELLNENDEDDDR